MLPSGTDPALSGVGFGGLSAAFAVQAGGLLEGGVDLLIIETQQDVLETRAAIDGARAAFRAAGRSVPIQVQVALDVTGRMLLGTDIQAVLTILLAMGAEVVGANCSVGPEHLREPVRYTVRAVARSGLGDPECGPAEERRRCRQLSTRASGHGRGAGGVRV